MRPLVLACSLALVSSAAAPARADAVLTPLLLRMLGPGGKTPAPAPAPVPASSAGKDIVVAGLGDVAGAPAKIDLPQLLQLAVRQSPALASATIDVEIAAAQVEQSLYLDDWTVQANAGGISSQTSFLGAGFDKTANAGASLIRNLATGGTVTLHAESSWEHSKSPLFESVKTNDLIDLTLTQPLLRGRGRKVSRALQLENALLEDAAALTRQQDAINVVQNIVTQYWDLVAAERNVEIARSSLQLAQERLRVTQIGVSGGKIADSELLAVEEAIATRQEDVLNGEVAVLQQSLLMRRTIGMEIGPGNIGLETGAELTVPERTWDLADLLNQAEHSSPQLASLAKQEQNTTLEVEVTENGLLPQLDLSLTLGPQGVASSDGSVATVKPAFDNFTSSPGLYAQGSVTFSESIGRHQVYGQERGLRAQREKIRVGATDVKLQIAQAMAQAVALVRAAEQRVQLGARAIELAQKNIVVEQSRFELGKSTNFDVLLRQDDLRQAQLREARAQVDWHKAQAIIAGLTGTLLADYGIQLGDR